MVGRRTILTLGLIAFFLVMGVSRPGFADQRYRVRSGDSLHKIAKKHGVTPQALRAANHLQSDSLKVKQVLVIPGNKSKARKVARTGKRLPADREIYVVKRGDTIYSVADEAGLSVKALKKMNRLRSAKLRRGQRLVIPKREQPDEMDELGDEDDVAAAKAGENGDDKQVKSTAIGKWKNPDERKLFVRITKTFLGVPYRLGGSTMRGIDCSAFTKRLYEIFDIQLPRTAREQSKVGKVIAKKEDLEEGDLVFFKTRSRRVTGHVGIYIGNHEFIHAAGRNRGTKLDSLESDYYSRRFVRGVRIMELEKELAKSL